MLGIALFWHEKCRLKDACGQGSTDARSNRDTDHDPNDHEDNPEDLKDDGNRDHVGDQGTDLQVLHVLCLCHTQNHPDVCGHRSEAVSRRIADSVKKLCEARMIAKQHEHRNENRSEDRPFCRTRGYENVYKRADDDEGYAHRKTGKANILKEISTCDCKQSTKVGPVEEALELSAEETEADIGTHAGHLFYHSLADV